MKFQILSLIFIIGFIFAGCSHTKEIAVENLRENTLKINYSVIYYIHADADYLYHTPDGDPVEGNSKVLATAHEIGETAHSGEVLIYYQRPERKLLGLFPRKSSRLFHYKNGQLVNRVKYRHRNKGEAFLATESQLMNTYRAQNRTDDHRNYFLYFGHEIPSEAGIGYHQTLPQIEVHTRSFADGMQNFLPSDEDRFALTVLSTCNNGTPAMAQLLMPFTDAMLASPQNLHLSHFETRAMNFLESEPDISPVWLARTMAEQSFQRLKETVHTTLTIALYDFEKVRDYINILTSLTKANEVAAQPMRFQDNVDCAEIYSFEAEGYRQGVEAWYRPARFGRQSGRKTHSGWGCKPRMRYSL